MGQGNIPSQYLKFLHSFIWITITVGIYDRWQLEISDPLLGQTRKHLKISSIPLKSSESREFLTLPHIPFWDSFFVFSCFKNLRSPFASPFKIFYVIISIIYMISLGYKLKKKRAFTHVGGVTLKILGMRPDVMPRGQTVFSRDRVVSPELKQPLDSRSLPS